MDVPLLDLKAQYATIRDEILAAVAQVIDSQQCIGGPKVAELEGRIAEISDCKFAVGVSSGTDAILGCLMSLDIGPGDEVITTPFTFFSTAGCVARVGAKPVFVDIDPKTFNVDVALIESAVTEKTKAIIPVHLFGQMADMDPIMEIAKKHDLAVIEDAAQSISSTYKGRKAGSIGTAGCLSSYPSKNLGGIGDGGMIVTNDEQLYRRMVMMRNHGQDSQYNYRYIGGNFRLDAVQAAALLVKLPHLDAWSQARRTNAAYYDEKFADSPVVTPFVRPDCVSIYNQYCVQLAAHLKQKGIGCAIYYPIPLHMNHCFGDMGHEKDDFPEAENAAKEVLALPAYPELTDAMKDYVAETLVAFIGK
jgi:dTDP-4-amino-4,6-dideoxygalactose transaminase